ncbi:unnamed protein product [Effrenium voratum]|uniref:PPPDE domain-containing protein n=1 Tax=Effrenium voratum TaxID=2562239 RepID=A0AA36IS80_9DINO|nr:unnamed protein product [Effrenium voratum]CAJ1431784.1 unnamed protein product [Effrenium voratum]
MAARAMAWFKTPVSLVAIILILSLLLMLYSSPDVSRAGAEGGSQKAVLDFHAALLKNMSMRVHTAEQALMELRQAHLDLRKKQDEAIALRRATLSVAKRGGGAPAPPPPAPSESHEEPAADSAEAEVPAEEDAEDGAEGPASEEQQKMEEEEQRKLIGYNEVTKTFKRFRPDFRCGSRVPLLPDDEVVECDRLSVTPCCSALGWCGRTKGHCRCATCIDYRKEGTGSQPRAKGEETCVDSEVIGMTLSRSSSWLRQKNKRCERKEACAALARKMPAAFQTLYKEGHRVELAASKLGPGFPGFQAYHTSVRVDELEYSFSGDGIVAGRGLPSHSRLPDETQVVYMGLCCIDGDEMRKHMNPHFKRGSYDLLRKNCNSFSDCALFFLLDTRLDPSYRGLEQLGHMADRQAGIVQAITEGKYCPNPCADGFSVERTIQALNKLKDQSSAFGFS